MPGFRVLRHNGTRYEPFDTVVYPDGESAAQAAKAFRAETGTRHRPEPIPDDVPWRQREQARFDNGEYKPVPWTGIKIDPDHFLHISRVNPNQVAYIMSETHGIQNRQTRVSPGRYLNNFHPDLSEYEIQHMVFQIIGSGDQELQFATTADDIQTVYRNGPSSCMTYSEEEYSGGMHPVRVYGDAGDLAIAFIGSNKHNVDARALVWPERKVYGRLYGDTHRLEGLLQAAGYRKGHPTTDFEGARLRRIRSDDDYDDFVAPYLDVGGYLHDDGEFLRMSARGELETSEEGVTSLRPEYPCDQCSGKTYSPTFHRGGGYTNWLFCDECAGDLSVCDSYDGARRFKCDMVQLGHGRWATQQNLEYMLKYQGAFTCAVTRLVYLRGEVRGRTPDGLPISDEGMEQQA